MAGDRAAIYHTSAKTAVTLNPTATLLWNALESPRTSSDLVDDLRKKFPMLSAETAQKDVDAFLKDMVRHELLIAGDGL